jgi:hypothetical protein
MDCGVCPPSKPAGTFPCACWPFWPRPPVLPLPDAGPRPRRIFLLYAPWLSDSEERIDAHRCCAATSSGWAVVAAGPRVRGVTDRSERARRVACNRGGMLGGGLLWDVWAEARCCGCRRRVRRRRHAGERRGNSDAKPHSRGLCPSELAHPTPAHIYPMCLVPHRRSAMLRAKMRRPTPRLDDGLPPRQAHTRQPPWFISSCCR